MNANPSPLTRSCVCNNQRLHRGFAALTRGLSALPEDFPATIVVLRHLPAHRPSLAAGLLGRVTPLEVEEAEAVGCGPGPCTPPRRGVIWW